MQTVVGFIQDIGPVELLLVLVIALFLFGAQRLPEVARSAGQAMAEFRRALRGQDDQREEGSGAESGSGATGGRDHEDGMPGSSEGTGRSGEGRSA
jgi:sec-independent protein translocase protein TatA